MTINKNKETDGLKLSGYLKKPDINQPLISIITVVFNGKQYLKDTIISVLNQTYANIEYIIIDGNSTDGTIDIIKEYATKIDYWISEPDEGIYHAINKGIKLATGDIIGILNSDDFYVDCNVITKVVAKFQANIIDCVYGDLNYVKQDNIEIIIRKWKSKPYNPSLFKQGWHPAHPTFFVKKQIYDKYGTFNLSLKIASDYELMLRFLEKYKIKSAYIATVLVHMRIGGMSNNSIKNIIKSNLEVHTAWKINNLKSNIFLFIFKPLSKILQYFKN